MRIKQLKAWSFRQKFILKNKRNETNKQTHKATCWCCSAPQKSGLAILWSITGYLCWSWNVPSFSSYLRLSQAISGYPLPSSSYLVKSDYLWLCQVILGYLGLSWAIFSYHGLRPPEQRPWTVVVGVACCWIVLNGAEWFWMLLNGLEWFWMVLNGPEWSWMVLNGAEWCWMVLNGAKCS